MRRNFSLLFQAGVAGCVLFSYIFALSRSEQVLPSLLQMLKVATLLIFSVFIVNVLSFLIIDFWFTRIQAKQPSKLLKFIVSVILYGIFAAVILEILGQDTTSFFTTSALFAAVVGFAMQEPLGNILSGMFMQISQPFQIGDWIEFEGIQGVVKSIDWNSTEIRQRSGEITSIPNGVIGKSVVKMVASGEVCREVDFTSPATIPPNQVMDIACRILLNHPPENIYLDRPLFARMWSYGLQEIEYKIFYYPKDNQEAENHTDPEIRRRLWYALNRAGLTVDYQEAEKSRLLQLVNETELFGDFSFEAKSLIVDISKVLLFDKDELFDDQRFLSRTMFLVIKGCVLVEQRLDHNEKGNTIIPLHRRAHHSNDHSLAIKPETLEKISLQLANYIGPVAFLIAAQAAQKASSLYSLYLDLSHEIVEPERRQEFLRYQPVVPTEELRPGDWFGEMSLLLGEPLPEVKITTIEETELLAITPRAILRALSHDNLSIETIAERVVAYHNTYLTATLQEVNAGDLHKNDILERIERNLQSDLIFMS